MYINLNVDLEKTMELENYIKEMLPQVISNDILQNKAELRAIIAECVRGQLRSVITEILQGEDFRDFLCKKVMKEIGMGIINA